MKRFSWPCLAVMLAVGCGEPAPPPEPEPVAQPEPPSERERLAALWEKAKGLQITRDSSLPYLIRALGAPHHVTDGNRYAWGQFEALDKDNHPKRTNVFYAVFKNGKLCNYAVSRPITAEGDALRVQEGLLMTWNEEDQRFLDPSGKDNEGKSPAR